MGGSRDQLADGVLDAIAEAVGDPVVVVKLLFECPDYGSALDALQREYGWTEIQARMVLEMQFRRVVAEDRQMIRRQLDGTD